MKVTMFKKALRVFGVRVTQFTAVVTPPQPGRQYIRTRRRFL